MVSEWSIIALEDSVDALIDYRGKTPRKTAHGIPLITAKIVKGGRIETPDEFISIDDYEPWMRRGIPKVGDVVITTEAPLGEVAQLGSERVALAQRLIAIRGKPGVLDNGFLKFLMQSDAVQAQLRARASGTTVLGIKQSELRKVLLTLPPLPEQRAIAAVLGALDDKIELNRRMNATLEGLARALFQAWFVEFEPVRARMAGRPTGLAAEIEALFPEALVVGEDGGERPRGWGVATISDLARIVGGGTPSTKEPAFWEDGEYYWTTPKDLSHLSVPILLGSERKITEDGLSQISSGLLPVGTVLLSSRAPIGYLAIAEVPTAINQGFIAMLPNQGVSNLYLLLWAETAHDDIVARANGSTFLEISKANFRPIELIVPPPALMEAFDQNVRPLYQRIVTNEQESRTLAALRDGLLPGLMRGEVRVNSVGRGESAIMES